MTYGVAVEGVSKQYQIEVEESDFYGTGKGITKYFGIVFLPCTWSLGNGTPTGVDTDSRIAL